jgi:hypothetical protein
MFITTKNTDTPLCSPSFLSPAPQAVIKLICHICYYLCNYNYIKCAPFYMAFFTMVMIEFILVPVYFNICSCSTFCFIFLLLNISWLYGYPIIYPLTHHWVLVGFSPSDLILKKSYPKYECIGILHKLSYEKRVFFFISID